MPLCNCRTSGVDSSDEERYRMANERSNSGSPGPDSISLGDMYEVREWTTSLGCTEVELRAVIQAIGNDVSKVRAYFDGK